MKYKLSWESRLVGQVDYKHSARVVGNHGSTISRKYHSLYSLSVFPNDSLKAFSEHAPLEHMATWGASDEIFLIRSKLNPSYGERVDLQQVFEFRLKYDIFACVDRMIFSNLYFELLFKIPSEMSRTAF